MIPLWEDKLGSPHTDERLFAALQILSIARRLLRERDEARQDVSALLIASDDVLEAWTHDRDHSEYLLTLAHVSSDIRCALLKGGE